MIPHNHFEHDDRNRAFAGLIVGVALGALLWVFIITIVSAAVRYAV